MKLSFKAVLLLIALLVWLFLLDWALMQMNQPSTGSVFVGATVALSGTLAFVALLVRLVGVPRKGKGGSA